MRFEKANSGAELAMAVANEETLVSEWSQSPSSTKFDEPGEFLDIVNMPMKRSLDAWCMAEHMDMPVLLQVA